MKNMWECKTLLIFTLITMYCMYCGERLICASVLEIYALHIDYHILIGCFFCSCKGRLLVLCLVHVQNSDSGSMTFCSKGGSSSQKTSPFHEIVSYAPEQLSSSSLGSSPDDNSSDGIKLDENEVWQFRLAYATKWQGVVFKICPYLDRYFLASAGNAVSSKSLALFSIRSVTCSLS